MKAVFFIDSYERWAITLESMEAMLKYSREFGRTHTIEVVSISISVMGLVRNVAVLAGWYERMLALSEAGVVFSVCRDSLMKFNSEGALLCEFANVVVSGVVEAVRRQSEGFAYIKA